MSCNGNQALMGLEKRRSRRRGGQQETFHSNGIEAAWISIVWSQRLLDRVMLLKKPNVKQALSLETKMSQIHIEDEIS